MISSTSSWADLFKMFCSLVINNWLRKWDPGMQKIFCEGDGSPFLSERQQLW